LKIKSLLTAVFIALSLSVSADTITGKVVGVKDGDTIVVLDDTMTAKPYTIRLIGIDTPEKKQAFGQAAKKHLSDMVFNKSVAVEYWKKDRYGRILGKVYHDNKDINLVMIQSGLAWHYKQYAKDQPVTDRSIYADAQESAMKDKKGLWSEPNPIPPWDFRRK
jgi:endonuclease YncB( thermonuclease family)